MFCCCWGGRFWQNLLSPAVPWSGPCPAVTGRRLWQAFWAISPALNISNPCLSSMKGLSLFASRQHMVFTNVPLLHRWEIKRCCFTAGEVGLQRLFGVCVLRWPQVHLVTCFQSNLSRVTAIPVSPRLAFTCKTRRQQSAFGQWWNSWVLPDANSWRTRPDCEETPAGWPIFPDPWLPRPYHESHLKLWETKIC